MRAVTMSYGYEPPKRSKSGSWSEVFLITRVAFSVLFPFLGALLGILVIIALTIFLFSTHPALALLTVIPVAAVIWYLLRRERRQHDEEVARIRGE
jgi:hypothetical protein